MFGVVSSLHLCKYNDHVWLKFQANEHPLLATSPHPASLSASPITSSTAKNHALHYNSVPFYDLEISNYCPSWYKSGGFRKHTALTFILVVIFCEAFLGVRPDYHTQPDRQRKICSQRKYWYYFQEDSANPCNSYHNSYFSVNDWHFTLVVLLF